MSVNHLLTRHPKFLVVIVLNQSVLFIGSKNFSSERQLEGILSLGLNPYPFTLVRIECMSQSINIFIGISKQLLYLIELVIDKKYTSSDRR